MIKTNKRQIGNNSENIAVNILLQKGYLIIGRNYFKRCGEIDIIAKDKEYIVFVEVKSLNTECFLNIYDTISYKKKIRLIKLAKIWLCENHKQIDSKFRIDFLGIVFDQNAIKKIVHLKNAIH